MLVQCGRWKPRLSSPDNSAEAKNEFIINLLSGGWQHLTPQDCSRWWAEMFICSSFPCHFSSFCAFGLLSPFIRVLMRAFLTEFKFRILYPIVPFCVSGVLKVSAHGRRGSWQISTYDPALALKHDVFIGILTLICLLAFISLHGII